MNENVCHEEIASLSKLQMAIEKTWRNDGILILYYQCPTMHSHPPQSQVRLPCNEFSVTVQQK